jgi:hypothetical protein
MAITFWEGLNQSKIHRIHLWDWSYIAAFFPILILNIWRWDADRGVSGRRSAQDPSGKNHSTLDVQHQVPYDTQFTFGSLTFAMEKDGNLKMLPPGSTPKHLASVYGQASCLSAISPTLDGACSASPDQGSTDDYLGIEGSTCWDSTEKGRLIIMVAPTEAPSYNSFSKHPIIGRSEASNARTPNEGMI